MTDKACSHEWIVYSTALVPATIMLKCHLCGERGGVLEHTREEWALAYYAPTWPFRWADESRVVLDKDIPEPTQEQLDLLARFLNGETEQE